MHSGVSVPYNLPEDIGFRVGPRGTHTSRTMMLKELTSLLAATDKGTESEEYWGAIIDGNVLGKKTAATRKLSAQRLSELYGLDPEVIMFRVLRELWSVDSEGRPLLASLCANARDPLLRMTAPVIFETPIGEEVEKEAIVALLTRETADRFKDSTRDKVARNAASSWTQSGHLEGRYTKIRTKPVVTPATVAYALLLGYLAGGRGESLLETYWTVLLELRRSEVDALAFQASRRGWLNYKHFGGVVRVDFSDMLTEEELEVVHGEGR
jgi:hypothetical protein